jgi:hypothetical protein
VNTSGAMRMCWRWATPARARLMWRWAGISCLSAGLSGALYDGGFSGA